MSIEAALRAARAVVSGEIVSAAAGGPISLAPRRRFVIGDPQAPIERFFEILDRHGLLDDGGWLAADAALVSVGDHFDFGPFERRAEAAASGLALLSWLAAHPADRVAIIAGNHDLGRVGELAGFDDETFAAASAEAALAYRGGDSDPALEAALLERWPALPTAELAARDFSSFAAAQRDLLTRLLLAGRMRIAVPVGADLLACHAGITRGELAALGYRGGLADANAVAAAVNAAFDRAVAGWAGRGRLSCETIHTPGDAAIGEGGGMLYHRPANPAVTGEPESYAGPTRRRYDPRTLPIGLTQIVGHIVDGKCRQIMGPWAEGEARPGAIRHLETDGTEVTYRPGVPSSLCGAGDRARLVFIDGGMNRVAAADYEILELP